MKRRKFVRNLSGLAAGSLIIPGMSPLGSCSGNKLFFDISLAEWSVRKLIRSGKITNLEFPQLARDRFGIHAVEYVSGFFQDRVNDRQYLDELKKRSEDVNVKNVLIMVDMWGPEGTLASPDKKKRKNAALNHRPWVDAAKYLGCHSIRVNASGYDREHYQEQYLLARDNFADGLSYLIEYGKQEKINILVENHGGLSSNARWLVEVMELVNSPWCGTLPDLGNFTIDRDRNIRYDPVKGLKELMPYAKGISAKTQDFDENCHETTIPYPEQIKVIWDFGYHGHIGIEWGGGRSDLRPDEGIRCTKEMLIRLGTEKNR